MICFTKQYKISFFGYLVPIRVFKLWFNLHALILSQCHLLHSQAYLGVSLCLTDTEVVEYYNFLIKGLCEKQFLKLSSLKFFPFVIKIVKGEIGQIGYGNWSSLSINHLRA